MRTAIIVALCLVTGCDALQTLKDRVAQRKEVTLRAPTEWLVDIDETTWTVNKINEEACKHEVNRETVICALAVHYKGKEPYFWD